MNHEQRRKLRQDAVGALKKAKGYVLLVLENDNASPVYYGDVTRLDNPQDVRHEFLHVTLKSTINGAKAVEEFAIKRMHDIEQTEAVEKAKQNRSEMLKEFEGF